MKDIFGSLSPVHYLPILTTLFSIFFLTDIGGRYLKKGGRHLMWWAIGVWWKRGPLSQGLASHWQSALVLSAM